MLLCLYTLTFCLGYPQNDFFCHLVNLKYNKLLAKKKIENKNLMVPFLNNHGVCTNSSVLTKGSNVILIWEQILLAQKLSFVLHVKGKTWKYGLCIIFHHLTHFFSFSGPSLAHYSECCGDYLWNSASNYVNGGASLPTTTFALVL